MKMQLLCAVVLCPGLAWGDEVAMESSIAAVTVYRDQAMVTRVGEVSLVAGEHELVLSSLPQALQDASLQVEVAASQGATLLDTLIRQGRAPVSPNLRMQELDRQIEVLVEEQRKLNREKAVLDDQRSLLEKVQQSTLGLDQKGERPSLEEVNSVMSLSRETLARLLQQSDAVETEVQKLAVRLQALQEERGGLPMPAARQDEPVKNLSVRVVLDKPGTLRLRIAYTVHGARWAPVYNARLDAGKREVKLDYFGQVQQWTGEDWSGVKMTLSTAQPSLGGNAPSLMPWVLDEIMPVAGSGSVQPAPVMYDAVREVSGSMAMRNLHSKKDSAQEPMQMAEFAPVEVDQGLTSASFQVREPVSVKSGADRQRVLVTALTLPAKLEYQSVPALQETAFLQVQGKNESDFPLLAGQLNAFLGNAFVASSHLDTVMPGEALKLDMGADEGLAVTRKLTHKLTETTGFTGSGKRVTYEYSIGVVNNKKTAESIHLTDQVPVSRNEKIVVKRLSPPPAEARQDKDGLLGWDWTLAPGEKRETVVRFSVDYPSDMAVEGLR